MIRPTSTSTEVHINVPSVEQLLQEDYIPKARTGKPKEKKGQNQGSGEKVPIDVSNLSSDEQKSHKTVFHSQEQDQQDSKSISNLNQKANAKKVNADNICEVEERHSIEEDHEAGESKIQNTEYKKNLLDEREEKKDNISPDNQNNLLDKLDNNKKKDDTEKNQVQNSPESGMRNDRDLFSASQQPDILKIGNNDHSKKQNETLHNNSNFNGTKNEYNNDNSIDTRIDSVKHSTVQLHATRSDHNSHNSRNSDNNNSKKLWQWSYFKLREQSQNPDLRKSNSTPVKRSSTIIQNQNEDFQCNSKLQESESMENHDSGQSVKSPNLTQPERNIFFKKSLSSAIDYQNKHIQENSHSFTFSMPTFMQSSNSSSNEKYNFLLVLENQRYHPMKGYSGTNPKSFTLDPYPYELYLESSIQFDRETSEPTEKEKRTPQATIIGYSFSRIEKRWISMKENTHESVKWIDQAWQPEISTSVTDQEGWIYGSTFDALNKGKSYNKSGTGIFLRRRKWCRRYVLSSNKSTSSSSSTDLGKEMINKDPRDQQIFDDSETSSPNTLSNDTSQKYTDKDYIDKESLENEGLSEETSTVEGVNDIRRALLTIENEIRMLHEEDELLKGEAILTWRRNILPKYKSAVKELKQKVKSLNKQKKILLSSDQTRQVKKSDEALWTEVKSIEKEVADTNTMIDDYEKKIHFPDALLSFGQNGVYGGISDIWIEYASCQFIIDLVPSNSYTIPPQINVLLCGTSEEHDKGFGVRLLTSGLKLKGEKAPSIPLDLSHLKVTARLEVILSLDYNFEKRKWEIPAEGFRILFHKFKGPLYSRKQLLDFILSMTESAIRRSLESAIPHELGIYLQDINIEHPITIRGMLQLKGPRLHSLLGKIQNNATFMEKVGWTRDSVLAFIRLQNDIHRNNKNRTIRTLLDAVNISRMSLRNPDLWKKVKSLWFQAAQEKAKLENEIEIPLEGFFQYIENLALKPIGVLVELQQIEISLNINSLINYIQQFVQRMVCERYHYEGENSSQVTNIHPNQMSPLSSERSSTALDVIQENEEKVHPSNNLQPKEKSNTFSGRLKQLSMRFSLAPSPNRDSISTEKNSLSDQQNHQGRQSFSAYFSKSSNELKREFEKLKLHETLDIINAKFDEGKKSAHIFNSAFTFNWRWYYSKVPGRSFI